MDPTPEPVPTPAAARLPRSVTVAAVLGAVLGFFGAWSALSTLQLSRVAAAPDFPDPLYNAYFHALWTFEQAHRRGVVALGALSVVLGLFLLVASVRVLARAHTPGALWRQALAGNCVAAAVTVWAERSFAPARLAAFRAWLARHPNSIPLPKDITADELGRAMFASIVWRAWLVLGILLLLLAFAGRNRTRLAIG